MRRSRAIRRIVLPLCAMVAAALAPASAHADAVAFTGGATAITKTSALLQGAVNNDGSESRWYFRYGRNPAALVLQTRVRVLSDAGVTAVADTARGLTPGTGYYFRLVVDSVPPSPHFGLAKHFSTAPAVVYGVVSLRADRLRVRHGSVSFPLRCAGARGAVCGGTLLDSAKTKHGRTVRCATGKFTARAGHSPAVNTRLGRDCAGLVKAAGSHRLATTLTATFSTRQKALKRRVTLIG
jgi:hypothetical protein